MNQDLISLLHDIGKDNAVEIIANYIVINPDVESLIATKMGGLLGSPAEESTSNDIPEKQQNNPSTSTNFPGALSALTSNLGLALGAFGSCKMIFVINMDLNMGRGKQCAQVAHAALGLYLDMQESNDSKMQVKVQSWIMSGQKKIVVKANNLEQMKEIQRRAREANLPNHLVTDAGCTQIAPGSKTVLAIFGLNEELDPITGSLKLL